MSYFEACDADGHMRMFGCRFGRDELAEAKHKADALKGYVRRGWTIVYPSPAYLKAHPMGGGGGGVGGMERVEAAGVAVDGCGSTGLGGAVSGVSFLLSFMPGTVVLFVGIVAWRLVFPKWWPR